MGEMPNAPHHLCAWSTEEYMRNFLSAVGCMRLAGTLPLNRQHVAPTFDAALYCLGRTRSQNIRPWMISKGGTTAVGMKNAAPSILASTWTPNSAW